jgi:hypothetical protein
VGGNAKRSFGCCGSSVHSCEEYGLGSASHAFQQAFNTSKRSSAHTSRRSSARNKLVCHRYSKREGLASFNAKQTTVNAKQTKKDGSTCAESLEKRFVAFVER